METPRQLVLRRRITGLLAFFIIGLVLSGLTAIPLRWEVNVLAWIVGVADGVPPEHYTGLQHWIATVRTGLLETYTRYPFMAYGTDWLAFAHVIIAIAFIGPLRDPVRNIWVINFGLIACAMVFPRALIFGPIRGIPLYWRLIDCSFGLFGSIPLLFARKFTLELAELNRG